MISQRKAATLKHHLPMICTGLIFLISAVVFVIQERWGPAGIALLMVLTTFVPWLIEKWSPARFPVSLQAQYALLLLAGPYVGGAHGVYIAWAPWDTLVHFYSGFPITFATISALGVTLHVYRLTFPVWLEVTVVVTVKAFIALLWEFGEFFVDLLLGTNTQVDNLDTMTDMLAGLTPGLVIAAALVLYRRNGWFGYIGRLLRVAEPQESVEGLSCSESVRKEAF